MTDGMLELIRTRRVIRAMSDRPIPLQDLEKILEAGRWAPAGGNQRVVRFVAVRDPKTLGVLRRVSPGVLQRPAAVIVLCLDHEAIRANEIPEHDPVPYVDIGTTMQTMLLAAHALGIGSGPVTSFAHEAVRVVLLPHELTPELMVCRASPGRTSRTGSATRKTRRASRAGSSPHAPRWTSIQTSRYLLSSAGSRVWKPCRPREVLRPKGRLAVLRRDRSVLQGPAHCNVGANPQAKLTDHQEFERLRGTITFGWGDSAVVAELAGLDEAQSWVASRCTGTR